MPFGRVRITPTGPDCARLVTASDSREVRLDFSAGQTPELRAEAPSSHASRKCDRIGPSAIEGDRLWFGTTFYSGEGYSGTGGPGYFDAGTRGCVSRRGLVRYDRQSRTTTRFDIGESIRHSFGAFRDGIALAVEDGVLLIRDGRVRGFIIDQTTDGRLRVAEAFNR